MLDGSDLIFEGVSLLKKYITGLKKVVIGIEKNKPECIEEMARIFQDDEKVFIQPLPSMYPQGGEKVLIYNTTERVVPEGKLPADVGVLVINVTSLAILAKYVKTGMPLVEKCVTVDGSAIKTPKNVLAPIGTPIKDLIDFVGGAEDMGKILFGGPMMGVPAASVDEPISKTTNAVTVLNVKDATEPEESACIHCGRCVAACPLSLNPTAFSKALDFENKEERVARLEDAKILLCMECGCCSYVCPANRPLVQNNRLGKVEVREYKAHLATLKKPE